MNKYQVTRESFGEILEEYGIMNVDELREFLSQFVDKEYRINMGLRDGCVYNSPKELEDSIEHIKKYGYESLIPWHSLTKPGAVEIRQEIDGNDNE